MSCRFEDELTAYVDQELPPLEMKQVEAHLSTCASCRATEGLLRHTIESLAAMPAPAFEPSPRLRRAVLERLEQPEGKLLEKLKSLLRPVVLLPSFGMAAAAIVVAVLATHHRPDPDVNQIELASNLEVARNMEVLENLDVVGVESAEDLEVIKHLHELEEVTP